MSLCGAVAIRRLQYPHMHCCSLFWELWREPQQAEQATWAAGTGEANILKVDFAKQFWDWILGPDSLLWKEGEANDCSPFGLHALALLLYRMFFLHYFPWVPWYPSLFKSPPTIFILCSHSFLKSLISSLLWPLVPSYCSALPLGSQGLPSYPLHPHPDSPVLSPLVPMGWGKASSTSACCQPLHMVPGL